MTVIYADMLIWKIYEHIPQGEYTLMAHSMTGYGDGRAGDNGLSIAVEVRCVNNRFLDLHMKLPRALNSREPEIREIVRQKVHRGRVSLTVTEEWSKDQSVDLRLDMGKARQYLGILNKLNDELELNDPPRLEHLLSIGDLFQPADDDQYRQRLWNLTCQAIGKALDMMRVVSNQEGDTLCVDLKKRIELIHSDLETVKAHAANQVGNYFERLSHRLDELIEDDRIDRNRLETEIALIADKLDISEEMVRLHSHLNMFEQTLKISEPIGKKLGFILQEMGREVNTISSKSWATEISRSAVRMKEVIEQIREQVQNIE